jgi:hypothetical protein
MEWKGEKEHCLITQGRNDKKIGFSDKNRVKRWGMREKIWGEQDNHSFLEICESERKPCIEVSD